MTTPTPKTVRSTAPSCFRSLWVGSSVSRIDCSIVLVRHRFIRDSSRSAEVFPHQDELAPGPRHLRHFWQNRSKVAPNRRNRPRGDPGARSLRKPTIMLHLLSRFARSTRTSGPNRQRPRCQDNGAFGGPAKVWRGAVLAGSGSLPRLSDLDRNQSASQWGCLTQVLIAATWHGRRVQAW